MTERFVLDAQSVDFPLGEKPMDGGDHVQGLGQVDMGIKAGGLARALFCRKRWHWHIQRDRPLCCRRG